MNPTLGCTTRPFGDVPFAEACQRIAAAGYTDVAVFTAVGSDSTREDVLAVRQTALDAGVTPSMLLAYARLEEGPEKAGAAYRRLIDHAVVLGALWLLDLGTARPEFYTAYVDLMRAMAPYAQDAGVQIAVKPHGGLTTTTDDLLRVHGQVNHPAYGICYDPGNIVYYTQGAERPETHIDRVAPLVKAGIIKDCIVRDGQPDVAITPGEGWVDFEAVLSGLMRGGFRGPLYLECVGGTAADEIDGNVRRTHAFVQAILDRLPG